MQVRRARSDESGEIAAVWLRSRAASAPHIPAPVHTDEDVRVWFETIVLPTHEVWVAHDDDGIVGLVVLHGEWIEQLYVAPGFTGHGIGGELIRVAKRQRPMRLRLWTFEANMGARRFYERHGFVATGATSGDNEEGAPDVRYEWSSISPADNASRPHRR